MTKLVWSPREVRDIEAIHSSIAEDSPEYADLMVLRILRLVERLSEFPKSGRSVPELNEPTIREVIAGPYRVIYRLRAEGAEVVTVFRGSQRFPDGFRGAN